jgi:hypothetical protein
MITSPPMTGPQQTGSGSQATTGAQATGGQTTTGGHTGCGWQLGAGLQLNRFSNQPADAELVPSETTKLLTIATRKYR